MGVGKEARKPPFFDSSLSHPTLSPPFSTKHMYVWDKKTKQNLVFHLGCVFFTRASGRGGGGREGGEGGTTAPSSPSTYKNSPLLVRRGGKILLSKVSLQLREGWAAHGGQSWATMGEGGGDEGKRDGEGEGQEEGEGTVPSNSMAL